MVARFGFIEAKKHVWEVVKISTGPWMQYADHKQALAEKDREITHLQDVYMKQRHKHDDDYQQLMRKAFRFAIALVGNIANKDEIEEEAIEFLDSPETEAWKE